MGQIRSGERACSYEAMLETSERAASGLVSLGVGTGDSVALMLRNDIAFFEASSAAGQVGAYPVPVNWHFTPDEAGYLFRNCGAKAVVIHADLLPGVEAAIPAGVAVLVVETPPEIASAYGLPASACQTPPGRLDWSAWLAGFPRRPREAGEPPGAIIYTGGTTGRPKGVRRPPPTQDQYLSAVKTAGFVFGLQDGLIALMTGRPGPDITTVVTGPMYHSAPNAYSTFALRAGGNVILQARFDPEELLALIQQHRVTNLHMVPTMFVRLLKLPDVVRRRYDLSSLKHVVHAAAPCPPHVKRDMIAWWGPIINEYYGSTETSAVTYCTSEEWLAHPGTVGRPLPNVAMRILREDGSDAPQGEPGDVYCRVQTASDFTYHGDDEKRRKAERDGLISVGDIGYLDADGFLHLCDRRNHMVISGGVNIYPAEIEAELLKVAGVADCAVFGIPDEEFGEALCAYIQPYPSVTLTSDQVRSDLATHLARYKVPRVIEFVTELPREDSGKIFKRKLREPYWANAGRSI
jgi:long-chain acyl-CoA synthetase